MNHFKFYNKYILRRYSVTKNFTNVDFVNIMYWSLQRIFGYKPKINP